MTGVDREMLAVLVALEPVPQALRYVDTDRHTVNVAAMKRLPLSSGERALVEWAGALWSGRGKVDLGYIAVSLGDGFLAAALAALAVRRGRSIPGFDSAGDRT